MKRKPRASHIDTSPMPTRTIDLNKLQDELTRSAEELRSAEEALLHASNMRRAAKTKHRNASEAFQQAIEVVTQSAIVSVLDTHGG